MSPSSTSNSSDWRRWLDGVSPFFWGLLVVLAAELALRAVDGARVFARPVKTGLIYMDEKRDVFLNVFLPNAKNPGILILGSSTADTNLDPVTVADGIERATGKRYDIFNGALYGTRLEDNLAFMKYYRKHWKYEKVFINIEPGVLRPGRMPNLKEKLEAYPIDGWLRDHSQLFRYRDQLRWWKKEDNEAVVKFDAETTANGWNRTLVMALANPVEEQVPQLVAPFPGWHVEPALMEEMAEYAKEEGFEIVWMTMPFRPDAQAAFPGEWAFPNITKLVAGIAEKHGQRFIDFSALRFPKEDFFDMSHLNGRGALKMSNIAGDRIGQMLAKDLKEYAEPAADVGDEAMPETRSGKPL